jgi:hypothetical protein
VKKAKHWENRTPPKLEKILWWCCGFGFPAAGLPYLLCQTQVKNFYNITFETKIFYLSVFPLHCGFGSEKIIGDPRGGASVLDFKSSYIKGFKVKKK